MTFDSSRSNPRWTKVYKGTTYRVSILQLTEFFSDRPALGIPPASISKTQEGSRKAANEWWKIKQSEIDQVDLSLPSDVTRDVFNSLPVVNGKHRDQDDSVDLVVGLHEESPPPLRRRVYGLMLKALNKELRDASTGSSSQLPPAFVIGFDNNMPQTTRTKSEVREAKKRLERDFNGSRAMDPPSYFECDHRNSSHADWRIWCPDLATFAEGQERDLMRRIHVANGILEEKIDVEAPAVPSSFPRANSTIGEWMDAFLKREFNRVTKDPDKERAAKEIDPTRFSSIEAHINAVKRHCGIEHLTFEQFDNRAVLFYSKALKEKYGAVNSYSYETDRTFQKFCRWASKQVGFRLPPDLFDREDTEVIVFRKSTALRKPNPLSDEVLTQILGPTSRVSERTQLYCLMALNVGCGAQDLSDLLIENWDRDRQRVIRKRSKTRSEGIGLVEEEDVRLVEFPLWKRTSDLLEKWANDSENPKDRLLMTLERKPLVQKKKMANGKTSKTDTIRSAVKRLGERKKDPIKFAFAKLRKTGGLFTKKHARKFREDLHDTYLGRPPKTITGRRYDDEEQKEFDYVVKKYEQHLIEIGALPN